MWANPGRPKPLKASQSVTVSMLLDDSQSASVSLPGPFWKVSRPKAALLHGYINTAAKSLHPEILSLLKIHQTPLPGFPDAFIKSAPALLRDFALKVQFPLLGKQEVHLKKKKNHQTLNSMYVSLQFCSPFKGWFQLFIVRVWTCEWRMYSLTAVRLSISDSCSGFYFFNLPEIFFSWGVRDM